MQLFFRFPEDHPGEDILEAFQKKVVESLKKQYAEVYDILDSYEIRLYKDVKVAKPEYQVGLEPIPSDLLNHINEKVLGTEKISRELSNRSGLNWIVDGVPYSDDEKVTNCLNKIIIYIIYYKYLKAIKEINRCRTLTMGPKERMIVNSIAGNCYYTLGDLKKAEYYFDESLRIAEREDLLKIYGEEIIQIKANQLGNIGLIYRSKGHLDKALEYHQDALKIHKEIEYKQGEASDLGNIGLIYRSKGHLDKALEYLERANEILTEFKLVYGKDLIEGAIKSLEKMKGSGQK